MFGRGEMKSNMTFLGHLIPVAASFSLVLGGCSTIEIGSDLSHERRFEPGLGAKVAVVAVSEQKSLSDQPVDRDPKTSSEPIAAPKGDFEAEFEASIDSYVLDRATTEMDSRPAVPRDPDQSTSETDGRGSTDRRLSGNSSPAARGGGSDQPSGQDLEATLMPAAGSEDGLGAAIGPGERSSVSDDVSANDFLRRMKATARALQHARHAKAAGSSRPVGKAIDESRPQVADQTVQEASIAQKPDRGRSRIMPAPELITEFEPVKPTATEVLVATTVAPKVREAVRSQQSQAPLSARIGFAGDKRALSPADRDQLEALSKRLRMAERRVHIRALADTSVREPSEARRLALKRLFVVRDFLVDQGLARTSVTLDAIAVVDGSVGDDRVEIAAGPARNRAPVTGSARRGPPSGSLSRDQFAAATLPAAPMATDSRTRTGATATNSSHSTNPAAPAIAVAPAEPKAPDPPPPSTEVRPADQATQRDRASIYVQVSSHRREQAAIDQANRLTKTFAVLLGAHEFRTTAVDLEGRGRFHRVRTGPFLTRSGASVLCRELQEQGQDCLVMSGKPRPESS